MKEVFQQKLMNMIIVIEVSTASLHMLDPVDACILDIWRKTPLYSTRFQVSGKSTGSLQTTYITREHSGQKLKAIVSQSPVRRLLIHPEMHVTASVFVKKEVAKGWMV